MSKEPPKYCVAVKYWNTGVSTVTGFPTLAQAAQHGYAMLQFKGASVYVGELVTAEEDSE